MNNEFTFHLIATDGKARRGEIAMPRGTVRTPAFMPVGTAGTVKAMYMDQVRNAGSDIILGNTYHLMLRPGAERVGRLGGLHELARWPWPILTDSGGFQVMSLAQLRKLNENGVTFQSHIDGARYELTPERSIEIQGLLDSDIQMQLDECVALPAKDKEIERAMELSLRWAERCKVAFGDQPGKAMFGIVQGGDKAPLRVRSAQALKAMDLKGYAVGGLAVGEPQAVMLDMLGITCPELPVEKPRYLMGVGTPDDILESGARRIDMFDQDRAPRPRLHQARQGQFAQCPPCGRPASAGRGERLPGGSRLFARLPAPPGQVAGSARRHATHLEQHRLLSAPHAGHSRRGRSRQVCRPRGGDYRRLGEGRSAGAVVAKLAGPVHRICRCSRQMSWRQPG